METASKQPLAGRTALVTGAAKRLGGTTALALAQQGVSVIIHYHQSQDQAVDLSEQIKALGVQAWTLSADLADLEQTQVLFEQATTLAGPIDILVNNASIFPKETLWETTNASLQLNMQIHAMAPLVLSRQLAQQQRPGQIINLLDTRITSYDQQHAAYHLSKRALMTLTRMLALELAPHVTVNAVAPGLILPPADESEDYLAELAHTNPMNRYGCEDDITEAIIYLLQSRFITGQVIYVDGGRHLKGRMYE